MVRLDTYQGALKMIRRIFDCAVCMSFALDLLAQPHSWMPYVQIGFRTALYIRSLLSMEMCDFFPRSQYRSLSLCSSCFRFVRMCCFQVSLLSKVNPRYFA
jgi:hypothetical protein